MVTTHGIIKDLIKNELVIKKPDKNNSQIHHLYINDENEFNRINKELSEIENIIDEVHAHISITSSFIDNAQVAPPPYPGIADFLREHMYIYKPPIKTMLQFLLVRTNNNIHSEKDKQVLHARIIESVVNVDHEHLYSDWTKTLDNDEHGLKTFLLSKDNRFLNPDHYMLADDLIKKIENFKKEFL